MRSAKNYIVIACISLFTTALTAQQYPFVQYTPKDGLVNNRARFTFQDSKGRLYISTYGGLSVFDGARFTNYTTENGLVTSLVNQVIEMGDDSLWIIPNGHAIHCMVNGTIKDFPLLNHTCPVINQLLKCNDGYYYAFTDEGFFRFEKDHFVKIPLIDRQGRDVGLYLLQGVEKDGKLFIISDVNFSVFPGNGKLLVFDLRSKKLLTQDNLPKFYFIINSPQNEILLSSTEGVKRIDQQSLKLGIIRLLPLLFYPIPGYYVPICMFFDSQQNLWISDGHGVLEVTREGSKHLFTTSNGLPVNNQTSIYQDRENVMWFTNEQTGLTKLANHQFEFYSHIKPGFVATDIYADKKSDSVWLYDGYHHTALLYYKNDWEKYQVPGNFYAGSKIAVHEQKAYLLDQFKIYRLTRNGRQHKLNSELMYQNPDSVYPYCSPVFDNNGDLITASMGISMISNNVLHTDDLGYLADQVTLDKVGRIWAGNRANKIFVDSVVYSNGKYELQRIHTFNKGLPNMSPRSITTDGLGNVWIGTRDHGVFCFSLDGWKIKSSKHLTLKDGLSENFISYLFCDADNNIWACSPAGLDKIKQKNGGLFIENITQGNNIFQYVRKVQTDRQGIVWVVTSSGLIKIMPSSSEPVSYLPHILFTEIIAGNKQINDPKNKLILHYEDNDITFHIAAPAFTDETMIRFSYLLEGAGNNNWSTPSTQSEINFANLPPGQYTLKAKAQFLNGQYPEQIAGYSFQILPPWWQTWWFRIGAGILVVLAAIMIIGEYVKGKLEKQKMLMEKQQAVERERTRIATDMHDDLGAGLTRIKFLSENIADNTSIGASGLFVLEKLKSSSNELVEKMSEIIWAMNEKNNTLEDLVFYLRSYAMDYCQENNLVCEFQVPTSILQKVISGQIRRNVFLVLKESLHNVVKHAAAQKVVIRIDTGKSITLTIHDDGKGLNNLNKKQTGNGLLNMQTRAEALSGTLKMQNLEGTTVVLNIPL